MRVRCLSLFAEYIDAIASGEKTVECRHFALERGPLALATNVKSGRAELRLLVDVVGASPATGGEEIDGLWYENTGYENRLANVRHLRRDAVRVACYNCAAGRRDTHAGIFYVEATLSPSYDPKSILYAPPVEAPRVIQPAKTAVAEYVAARVRVPPRNIRPPVPTAAPSPLLTPHAATPPTALRPQDPFALRRDLLADAIAEFGDTPEIRALFGEEK